MGDNYMPVRKCTVKCLVLYEDLIKLNSHLQIRKPNKPSNSFKKPRQPAVPKPASARATRGRHHGKKEVTIDAKHILHDTTGIDTKDYVDDTMVCFLPEFCQRIGMKQIPRDPMDLCKKFTLIIPDVGSIIDDNPIAQLN